ncbi:MAG: ABC transporter permease [Acidobacteria bacterium]|nr:ABC transporter permease [Acidobacteriota bacterium]
MATDSLLRHKLRTILTMLGIIFGVAAVLAMMAIGSGAEREALSLIENMGLRNVIVQAKEFEEDEMKVIRQDSPGLCRADMRAMADLLGLDHLLIGKKQLKAYQIVSALGKADSRVLAVSPRYPEVAGLEMLEGAFFLPSDDQGCRPFCVLGTTARRKLFGLNPALGQPVKINDIWFTVIGVLQDRLVDKAEFEGVKIENPNDDIFIPIQTLFARFETNPVDNELDEIIIKVPATANLQEQSVVVSAMLAGMHRQIDDFRLVVPERLLQQNRQTQRIFNIVMGAIASISLLVGGIGIMNIMLASVLERTSEIGLRRAIGARRRDIGRQFLVEAVTISLVGSMLGIALGYAISRGVAVYSGWTTVITPLSILLGVGVSTTVGMIFGFYPARQAARVSPIEALRRE